MVTFFDLRTKLGRWQENDLVRSHLVCSAWCKNGRKSHCSSVCSTCSFPNVFIRLINIMFRFQNVIEQWMTIFWFKINLNFQISIWTHIKTCDGYFWFILIQMDATYMISNRCWICLTECSKNVDEHSVICHLSHFFEWKSPWDLLSHFIEASDVTSHVFFITRYWRTTIAWLSHTDGLVLNFFWQNQHIHFKNKSTKHLNLSKSVSWWLWPQNIFRFA